MSARPYTTTEQLDALRLALSGRDMAILRTLRAYRLASGSQLQRMHFAAHPNHSAAGRAMRHALGRLATLRLVDHLERRIGGVNSGSTGYVWYLARTGIRLLAMADQRPISTRLYVGEPSLRKVDHTLAVTEVGTRLIEAARSGLLDLIEYTPEPSCWRTYLSHGGTRATLKPDLFIVTAKPDDDHETLHFIEVDRATESVRTVTGKAEQYQAYRATGREQQHQQVFPHVAWLTPTTQRAERITEAFTHTPRIDAQLHTATVLDEFIASVAGQAGSGR